MSEEVNTAAQDAAPGDTLLTGQTANTPPDGQNGQPPVSEDKTEEQGDQPKEGEPGQAANEEAVDPAKAVPEKPDGYKFEFGEDSQIDEAMLGGFREIAHQLGITQEQAQKLAGFYEAQIKGMNATALEARTKQAVETEQGWLKEIKGMPDFDSRKADADKAMEQFGNPELVELLNNTRLGSHPTIFKFVADVGKALGEPGFVRSKDGAGERSLAEKLYPNQGKGE